MSPGQGYSKFEAHLRFGTDGEHIVGRRLTREGVVINPLWQHANSGKAPAIYYDAEGSLVEVTLPDMTCWLDGVFHVEVKVKQRWVHWHGRMETGFNTRAFAAYQKVEVLTGHDVWVAFLHLNNAKGREGDPLGVFVQRLGVLNKYKREWDGLNCKTGERVESPLTLFPRECLHKRWGLEDLDQRQLEILSHRAV